MTVEQTLMCSIHAVVGLTSGGGMTYKVVSPWINSIPVSAEICDTVGTFGNLYNFSSYHMQTTVVLETQKINLDLWNEDYVLGKRKRKIYGNTDLKLGNE